MLLGFKLGEQVFDDPGVDPVAGGVIPYCQSVYDDIHEIIIYRKRIHYNKFGG